MIVPKLSGHFCPKCGEGMLEDASNVRYLAALDELVREANLATMPDLRAIRKRLKLSQVEAAQLFGGGVNAFSRYERGETEPPRSLVQLLRILDRRPELLAELRPEAGAESAGRRAL